MVVNGRTEERVSEAVKGIAATHPKAKVRGVAADLATAAGVEEFVRRIPETDILVNSPLSSATNGAALRVDGGVVKSPF